MGMNKIFKYVIGAVIAVVAVLLIAAVGVFLFFDPNDYRDEIAVKLSETTGREVRIEGDLSMSLFPWLAVQTGRISVAAAPGFGPEPMAAIDGASAAVRIAPLLRGAVRIGTVTLSGLDLKLAVRGDGLTSWDDLLDNAASSDAGAPADASGEGLADFSIEGIIVDDANVTYSDIGAGSEYRLSGFGLQVDAVNLEEPIPFKAGFSFSMTPAEVRGDITIKSVATLSDGANGAILMLRDLLAEGQVQAPSLSDARSFSVQTPLLALDFGENSTNLEPARFAFGPLRGTLEMSGSGPSAPVALSGAIDVERFDPAVLFAMLAMDAPETTDPDALDAIAFESRFGMTYESVTLNELQMRLDDTTISGVVAVENFARPMFRFELNGDSINLDGYLPPADDAQVAADAGDNLAESALPVDLIRGLDADGTLQFASLTFGELPFRDLKLGLKVGGDKARLQPISATVLGGSYNGDVRIDASGKTPSLSLNETVSGVDLGELAKLLWERDNIEGQLGGNFALSGRGETLSAIRSSLDGKVSFELTDGALAGTDIWYQIRRARALFKQETPPPAPSPARTEFSTVRGSAIVAGGIATNDDLFAELPFLQLTGKGKVNLAEATVDYGLRARVLERPDFMTNATEAELDEYTEAVIPLRISGDIAAPSIRPDIEGMASEAAKKVIDAETDKLKRKLLDSLGGDDGDEGDESEEPEDIEDEAKRRLRDLFRR